MHKENSSKHEALKQAVELIIPTEPMKEKDLSETMKQFQLNVNKSQQAKQYLLSRSLDCQKLEVGYNGDSYKDLKHCIVFPLKDKSNNIVSLYGRSIYNNTDQKHFYQTSRKGLYPGYPKPQTKTLILTEAIIDAATLLQIPVISDQYSVLSAYGTNGLTGEHLKAIKELKQLKEIVFAFDSDAPGQAAVIKYSSELRLSEENLQISKIELPCKDVNETLIGHNEAIFNHLLEKRIFLFSTEKTKTMESSTENKNLQDNPVTPDSTTNAAAQPMAAVKAFNQLNTDSKEQYFFHTPQVSITLFGGVSLQYLDRLRVTLYIKRNPHLSPVYGIRQTIDLYHHDALEKFVRQASEKTQVSTSHIMESLCTLTEQLEGYRVSEVEKKKAVSCKPLKKVLTQQENALALKNLQGTDLMQWTMEGLMGTGIIGERENIMILFYSMVSRLLESPVSVIILSGSGSGKSYLLERVAKCFPGDEIIENTHLTDNSLYYFRSDELKHKIMIIEDMDGAQNVEYAIRELISKKYITKTAVHKDNKGNLHTEQYRVEGPVAFFGCTTRESLYDDNANRIIPIYLNSGKDQDQKIMQYHKRTKTGEIDIGGEQQIRKQLQDMQQLLKHYPVINPYATLIDLPQYVLKPRRALGIVFSFIEAITLYHQYQPCQAENKAKGFLQVTPDHIQMGFELLKEPLFRKSDELSGEVRNFLDRIRLFLKTEARQSFFGSDIRLPLKLHPRTLRNYLYELRQFGYIKISGGDKYRRGYEYELTDLGGQETIRPGIDAHIGVMMKKIWDKQDELKKGRNQ
jgi:DNA primase